MPSKVSVAEANAYLIENFESVSTRSNVDLMAEGRAVMSLTARPEHLRPGGYISGPTQMSIADSAAYMAVMTRIGIVPMAVTSNLNINFLRPCIGDAVIADARLIKLGRTLAVIDVDIKARGSDKTASHAMVTYAIPQEQ
ncbi:MAG: PaaI family thioesterase [Henriciella sp.]